MAWPESMHCIEVVLLVYRHGPNEEEREWKDSFFGYMEQILCNTNLTLLDKIAPRVIHLRNQSQLLISHILKIIGPSSVGPFVIKSNANTPLA